MSQATYYSNEERGWWDRLIGGRQSGVVEGGGESLLPADSLFTQSWGGGATSVADVPESVKSQIREEAVLTAFNRLAASLRLLLYATTPGKEPPTAERCHQILNVWRYELEHHCNLTPDTYCGAVKRYDPLMDEAYTIDGRCAVGDLLKIRVPCWRMFDRIVVRGEAELVKGEEHDATASLPQVFEKPAAEIVAPMVAAAPLVEPEAAVTMLAVETLEASAPMAAAAPEAPPALAPTPEPEVLRTILLPPVEEDPSETAED